MLFDITLREHNEFGDTAEFWIKDVTITNDLEGIVCSCTIFDPSNGFEEVEYISHEEFEKYWDKLTLNGDPMELSNRKFEIDYDPFFVDGDGIYMIVNYVKEIDCNIHADALIYNPKVESIEGNVYNITGTFIKRDADGLYRTTSKVINVQAALPNGIFYYEIGDYFGVTRVEIDSDGNVVNHGKITIANSNEISDVYICKIFELNKHIDSYTYTLTIQLYRKGMYGFLSEVDEVFEYDMSELEYRKFTALVDRIDTDRYYLIEGLVILNENGDIFARFDRLFDMDDSNND